MTTTDPFPLSVTLKVNSPQLLAFLAQFGDEKFARAEDFNQIFEALNFLYENLGGGLIQNNFVRKLTIYENSLSGIGTIEDQVCEFILALPEAERTILETDSAWTIEVVAGSNPALRKHNSKFNSKFN